MVKTITCIICPKSCKIKIENGEPVINKGISCSKGKKYALSEAGDPRRIFTSTVKIENGEFKRAPVRSSKPIRKDDWKAAIDLVNGIKTKAPLGFHEIVWVDFMEKGTDLISTRNVLKKT